MNRRSFIKRLGFAIATAGLAANGVYASAKETIKTKAEEFGIIKVGDVFTIEGILDSNGNQQKFTATSAVTSDSNDTIAITPS